MKLSLLAMLFLESVISLQSGNGVLTGQLLTRDGAPAVGVRVMIVDAISVPASPVSIMGITETDAFGRYRLNNVLPGRYYIQAGVMTGPTYYPGVGDVSNAKAVVVTRTGVNEPLDFVIEKKSVGLRVNGHVHRGDGDNSGIVDVILVTGESDSNPLRALVNIDGSFEISKVPPGNYVAKLRMSNRTTFSEVVTVVDKDVSGVELRVPKLLEITGRVILEGGGNVPTFFLRVEPPGFGLMTYNFTLAKDGSFKAKLPEGLRFTVQGFNPTQYALKSVTYGSVDLFKDPLKSGGTEMIVTFAQNPAR